VTAASPWRRRALPILLGVLLLNVGVFAAYTFPRTLQVRSATSRALAARAEVGREREAVAELRLRTNVITANTQDAERFYGSVAPRRTDVLAVVEDVEKMAKEPGLKPGPRGFAPAEVKDPRLVRVKITLPLEGSYDQLVAFLDRVERSKHFLTVDRISLHSAKEGMASLQVELSAYFRSEGRPLAAR
jgi:Tfp pilus assembly protein PilO